MRKVASFELTYNKNKSALRRKRESAPSFHYFNNQTNALLHWSSTTHLPTPQKDFSSWWMQLHVSYVVQRHFTFYSLILYCVNSGVSVFQQRIDRLIDRLLSTDV